MKRIHRSLLLSVLASTSLTLLGCQFGSNDSSVNATTTQSNATPEPVKIGSALYKSEPMPALPVTAKTTDLLIIPNAVVKNAERQMVPAAVDGTIDLVAVQLAPGEKYNPNDKRFVFHPRDKELGDKRKVFRTISPGTEIKKGDIVTWMDSSQVESQYRSAQELINSAKNTLKLSKEGTAQVSELLAKLEKAGDSIAITEKTQMLIQKIRFEENASQAEQTLIKAQQDYENAASLFRKHQPTSTVSGRVTNVFKRPGEYARAGEPILEIQSTEVLIVEGEIPIQYSGQVKPGTEVRIESTKPVAESRNYGSISHRREVTGLAVTSNKDRPLVVSCGLDSIALVWEPGTTKNPHPLPHPAPVRTLAVTGPKAAGSFCITGAEDGKVRIWNLSNPDKLPKDTEAKVCDESHSGPVTASAFSPDGKYFATSAGREIFVWEAATGKKLYSLSNEHKDAVTMLRFTPQATLITASRDKSVRIWNIGNEGAAVSKPENRVSVLDHRVGNVDQLSVTSDGTRITFDQEDGRLEIVSLADGHTVGHIQSPSKFGRFAVFSPDDSLVLTANGVNNPGEMQLWETPNNGMRAFERMRLNTPNNTPVTCAAFSNHSDPKLKFVVIGTVGGGVYLWTSPTEKNAKTITGVVESVLNYNDKKANVRVRVFNPPPELEDRGTANIIIDPNGKTAMATPSNMMTVPVVAPVGENKNVLPVAATSPLVPPPASPMIPMPNPLPSSVSPGLITPIPAPKEPTKQ